MIVRLKAIRSGRYLGVTKGKTYLAGVSDKPWISYTGRCIGTIRTIDILKTGKSFRVTMPFEKDPGYGLRFEPTEYVFNVNTRLI